MNEYTQNVREAVIYLKEYPIFCRLMESFRKKYLSYGRFGGTVVLGNLTAEDIEALEGFFQTGFHGRKQVRITAAKFQKALAESRFAPATAGDVLQAFFGETLQGKKQQEQERKSRQDYLFERMAHFWEGTLAASWVQEVWNDPDRRIRLSERKKRTLDLPKPAAVQTEVHANAEDRAFAAVSRKRTTLPVLDQALEKWCEQYSDFELTNEEIHLVWTLLLGAVILEELPVRKETFEHLPVFAARVTGDPHYFDRGTSAGTLLYQVVQWMDHYQGNPSIPAGVFSSFRRQRFFLRAGILQGDSSNYAMLYGVQAFGKDGQPHQGMAGFVKENHMVQVPLHVIETWASLSCPDHRIWIVENPSVYSVLCQQAGGRYACMCMNGQPNLSALRILDLLSVSDNAVYYAGDFDPEGLLIAQKLKQYYQGPFYYWHMTAEDCRAGLSGVLLTEQRIRSLSRITDPALRPAAEVIRQTGRAGYQENLWERYLPDPPGNTFL